MHRLFSANVSLAAARILSFAICLLLCGKASAALTLERRDKMLVIHGDKIPAGEIRVWYLEAYCRSNSTDTDWDKTVIPHTNQLVSFSPDHKVLRLRDQLADGLIVDHIITARDDEIDFQVDAKNHTDHQSEAHWAQPCIQLGPFTGFVNGKDMNDYLPKCFIFLNGKLERMPTRSWARHARYEPGQVWCPKGVPRTDVNPRPLSPLVSSDGLIGCFSADEKWICATAWEPYQELFQGVVRCLHSDFRLGGLRPGETRHIHGKIYVMKNNVKSLLKRYRADFPQQSQ